MTELEGANFEGAFIEDLRRKNIALWDEQLMSLSSHLLESCRKYDRISFADAVKEVGASEKQFEFFVVSGALEVRDNVTCLRVEKDFDPEKHHVTRWHIAKLRESLASEMNHGASEQQ